MNPSWKTLVLAPAAAVLAVIGLWALPGDAVNAGKASGATKNPDVLAKVGDLEITRAEVEDVIASQLLALERQRYDLLEGGLEKLIHDRLLEATAAERNLTVDELVAKEVDEKTAPVTDDAVQAFYEEKKAQIQQPFEQIEGRIREFLEQQGRDERMQAFMTELRDGHTVQTFLEPLRVAVDDRGPTKGPAEAPVTIVEFSDFQCPYCGRIAPTLAKVHEEYPDQVRIIFRQFPLRSLHPNAQKAAEASLCADEQGKFWEMHDLMFEEQRSLEVDQLKEKAARLGLDSERFNECLETSRSAERVDEDLNYGAGLGVTGTPAMFINGRFTSGAMPYDQLAKLIDDELNRAGG